MHGSRAPFGRAVALLGRAVEWAAVVLLAALTFLAAAEALVWTAFERSLPAVEEVAGVLLVWLGLLAGAHGVERGLHLGVDVVASRLPRRWRRGVARGAAGLVAVFGILLAVYGWRLQAGATNTLPATRWPAAVQYLPVAVGGVLIAVFAAARALLPPADDAERSPS